MFKNVTFCVTETSLRKILIIEVISCFSLIRFSCYMSEEKCQTIKQLNLSIFCAKNTSGKRFIGLEYEELNEPLSGDFLKMCCILYCRIQK